jgi:hypothetical protein
MAITSALNRVVSQLSAYKPKNADRPSLKCMRSGRGSKAKAGWPRAATRSATPTMRPTIF